MKVHLIYYSTASSQFYQKILSELTIVHYTYNTEADFIYCPKLLETTRTVQASSNIKKNLTFIQFFFIESYYASEDTLQQPDTHFMVFAIF